jgi:formate C-acetyltransferase
MTATVTPGARAATGAWRGFAGLRWRDRIDVRDFIQANYTPYEGDSAFLVGPTERSLAVWHKVARLFPEERRKGILDVDPGNPSTITSHRPGYIDREREHVLSGPEPRARVQYTEAGHVQATAMMTPTSTARRH